VPGQTIATHRLLRAFCDELARCGMRLACTSPGSRNTPIVLSLVRESRLRCYSHIDERCSGFFAVGAARESGLPVAVTCTSGTAAAELAPAVIEAHWGRVPLIVLTADRPAELRDVGAGQAIDQLKLYGDAAKWFCEVELAPVVDAASMRAIRRLACRAYWTALEGRPGPVHLNLPLREPLILQEPLGDEREFRGRSAGAPWVRRGAGVTVARLHRPLPARTVLVAGGEGASGTSAELIAGADLPVLADPLSPARAAPGAIATYDLILRDPAIAAALAPECVVRVGDLPTSKPLRAWLASLGPEVRQVALDPHGTWQDPDAIVGEIIPGEVVPGLLDTDADPGWLRAWRAADEAAGTGLTAGLADEPGLSEPLVARRLGEWLSPADTLFVASSMPIRDVELYLPAGVPLPRVLSNRGANGIDGTVSSALGAAAADPGRRVVLLIGDVALAHDIGGLLAARRHDLALTIVLLHNDGGGIFHFLPVSGEGETFVEHVATPHGLDFSHAAALYGLGHVCATTEDELREALAAASGTTLIEVRTDREENLALHRRLAEGALAAISRRAPAA
jgi:2-succinyl-5-enolpyruvyl-6-hydroxy-3-cyclohexene-1-carboxylate synthase